MLFIWQAVGISVFPSLQKTKDDPKVTKTCFSCLWREEIGSESHVFGIILTFVQPCFVQRERFLHNGRHFLQNKGRISSGCPSETLQPEIRPL
ncbi:hypothetical protein AAV35_011995 [Salimicrobium jeotgali]|uniref:Uncharacterized protein n=1 Tax=Salimicrobium jeotgali TaxID=1230341 RepID=A0AAC8PV28_9BACI|nr:hypothetical protein AAV35_011995 [Salimicrobium jeotgali]